MNNKVNDHKQEERRQDTSLSDASFNGKEVCGAVFHPDTAARVEVEVSKDLIESQRDAVQPCYVPKQLLIDAVKGLEATTVGLDVTGITELSKVKVSVTEITLVLHMPGPSKIKEKPFEGKFAFSLVCFTDDGDNSTNEETEMQIVQHILTLAVLDPPENDSITSELPLSAEDFHLLLNIAKRLQPDMTKEAASLIKGYYVTIRKSRSELSSSSVPVSAQQVIRKEGEQIKFIVKIKLPVEGKKYKCQ
ncbi:hypothetical protein CHS0354_037616 [Potamilus streckersoni]|uniref:Uncharacterized protein n=1 Tax=Potamilus streckersoni TaxID=2493646 RepID=A0AAE0RUV5_9BIVA|nr:hypothetical protein CHS0354_037616 [Potamilus streckersoni]